MCFRFYISLIFFFGILAIVVFFQFLSLFRLFLLIKKKLRKSKFTDEEQYFC